MNLKYHKINVLICFDQKRLWANSIYLGSSQSRMQSKRKWINIIIEIYFSQQTATAFVDTVWYDNGNSENEAVTKITAGSKEFNAS